MRRIEPGAAGWDAQMQPLCYAAPIEKKYFSGINESVSIQPKKTHLSALYKTTDKLNAMSYAKNYELLDIIVFSGYNLRTSVKFFLHRFPHFYAKPRYRRNEPR